MCLFINLYACKEKEDLHYPLDLGPLVLSPYHISAYVDGILIDAAYGYIPSDSYYESSDSIFGIRRNTNNDITPNVNQAWTISGYKINLDSISYPKTYWLIKYSGKPGSIYFNFTIHNGGLTPNTFDSSLFSLTLSAFEHDTLSGIFQGDLYRPSSYHFADSIMHVTNGQFKILLSRI